MPIFRPTVSTGGAQSLKDEAIRLQAFANNSVAVPDVLALDDLFLVTSDVGIQLHQCLRNISSKEESEQILKQAIQALNNLHTKGFCHGRPSFGDMTIKDRVIYFIDLEENPLTVMTLAQAQARDLWLFLNNAARYSESEATLIDLFQLYRQNIQEETLVELKRLVKRLKPARIVAELTLKPLMGRDLKSAIKANRALETAFKA